MVSLQGCGSEMGIWTFVTIVMSPRGAKHSGFCVLHPATRFLFWFRPIELMMDAWSSPTAAVSIKHPTRGKKKIFAPGSYIAGHLFHPQSRGTGSTPRIAPAAHERTNPDLLRSPRVPAGRPCHGAGGPFEAGNRVWGLANGDA